MKNSVGKKFEIFFIFNGILLILIAFVLLMYDVQEDRRAGNNAEYIMEQIYEQSDEKSNGVNLNADDKNDTLISDTEILLNNKTNTDREMPLIEVDGNYYVGTIDIPALNISLPVMNEWSYPNLKLAPCRYYGSIYSKNMVIASHNYERFFGLLKNLDTGSSIIFTDNDGNEFDYVIEEITLLSPWEVDEMTSGEFPLTLFTCNYSGQQRVTVRCKEVEKL